ncbi:MAG: hypothetical protein IIA44_15580, partial [Acidobacteria bacterium]|nr:hypothetical protein [Acidobacteriota bacterium]
GAGGFTYGGGAASRGRGITVDFDGNIWMACDLANSVAKYAPTSPPTLLFNALAGSTHPIGVGVAADGNIITVGQSSSSWGKVDKATGATIATGGPQLTGPSPYTYSDFTGSLSAIIGKQGFWTVVYDGGILGEEWGTVSWNSDEPIDTDVGVEVRAADAVGDLASETYVSVADGVSFSGILGKYIQIRVRLTTDRQDLLSPILYDLTVCPLNTAPICDANGPYAAECEGPCTAVTLDGSGSSDPDCDNLTYEWIAPGVNFDDPLLQNPTGCFPFGITQVTLIVFDGTDHTTCATNVTIEDTTPPTITCLPNTTVANLASLPPCDPADATATDICGVTVTCSRDNVGGVNSSQPIPVTYWYTAVDAAGNTAQCSRVVTATTPLYSWPVIVGDPDVPIATGTGRQVSVPVTLNTDNFAIGKFDLLVGFDRSAMSLISVDQGEAIEAWEYFTYRLSAEADCGEDCPSGLLRLVGVADLHDGAGSPPDAAFRIDGAIAHLTFEVSADQDLIGRELPLSLHRLDLRDNTITDKGGSLAFVSEDADVEAYQAANPDKLVLPNLAFRTGVIRITEPIDGRGDVNLNGMAYEVGDAVLLSSYLIHGNAVLSDDPGLRARQIAASDINNDGVVLSVGDLVYLIRVLTGEAAPAGEFKRSPYAATGNITYRVEHGAMTVSTTSSVDLGGALFVFRYSG